MKQYFCSLLVSIALSSVATSYVQKPPTPHYAPSYLGYKWAMPVDYGVYSVGWPPYDLNVLLQDHLDKSLVYSRPAIINQPTSYEVREEVFDSEPPARLFPPPRTTIALGSGSLGIVHLGNGNFALGSGSLGYATAIIQEPKRLMSGTSAPQRQSSLQPVAPVRGGLHEVPAPQLYVPTAQQQSAKDFAPKAFPTTTAPYLDFNSLQQFDYHYIKV